MYFIACQPTPARTTGIDHGIGSASTPKIRTSTFPIGPFLLVRLTHFSQQARGPSF
jgi:hypothetical protein